MSRIIGVCGVARAGKDSLYHILSELFPEKRMKRLAFADALKEECRDFLEKNLNISPFTANDEEKELIRPFLVTYGTHLRRRLDPDCWIKVLQSRISSDSSEGNYVITDARFPNELNWIKESGGYVIHVEREGALPANKEEEENDPILKDMSDIKLELPTFQENYLAKCKTIIEKKLKKPQIWN